MFPLTWMALGLLPHITAAPSSRARTIGPPTVQLSYATVVGSSLLGVDTFNAIPYAQPPVGQLRLKPPQPITSNLGIIVSPLVARACPQFFLQVNSANLPADALGLLADTDFGQAITNAGEDCLTLNVQRPSTATPDSKLPVVFWMFGGGFEFGSTQLYNGASLIQNSMLQKQDVIFVAVNYRVGGFGWLPGNEILQDGSANLGHLDQRLGLQWVADNIALFGGDPEKVTIWGESAGSISVFNQMALFGGDYTYKGKNLFRAAIMDSGSVVPTDPVNDSKGQAVYDTVVKAAGCSGSNDTLACLRSVDYETYLNAANSVPEVLGFNSLALSYLPRPDGTVLTASPDAIANAGSFAPVPFIVGDQEDEGTLFSLFQENITTTDEFVTYLNTIYFQDAPRDVITDLVNLYPEDPSAGSPFRTGLANNIYPQFKRIAALLGDLTFTITRRNFLQSSHQVHPNVPTWSYLASYLYGTPVLGTFHASDVLQAFDITPDFASNTIQSYYISFINTMNPNPNAIASDLPQWPVWTNDSRTLINFQAASNGFITDDFRQPVSEFISQHQSQIRI